MPSLENWDGGLESLVEYTCTQMQAGGKGGSEEGKERRRAGRVEEKDENKVIRSMTCNPQAQDAIIKVPQWQDA